LQGVTVAPDVALTDVEPETDIENVLPPDPPAIFFQKKLPQYQPTMMGICRLLRRPT
jgi:hypothetical protein